MPRLSRFRTLLLNLLVAIVSTAVTLGALEVAVRGFRLWVIPDYGAVHWYRASDIPGVPYLLQPNLRVDWGLGEVVTNAEGLRASRSFSPGAHPGTRRILALGDSITFGFGVGQADSFPEQLERFINREQPQDRPVEVINAGVNGFSLADEAAYLEALVNTYQPDAIVWTLVPNDYDDSFAPADGGFVQRRPVPAE